MPNGFRARSLGAKGLRVGLVLCLALLYGSAAAAQPQAAPVTPPAAAALLSATPSSEAFTFTYVNRTIVRFKANVLGRSPAERAAAAERALDDLVAQRITGPVTSQLFEGGALISVGSRTVLGVATADVDNLSGETVQDVSLQVVGRLQVALEEAA